MTKALGYLIFLCCVSSVVPELSQLKASHLSWVGFWGVEDVSLLTGWGNFYMTHDVAQIQKAKQLGIKIMYDLEDTFYTINAQSFLVLKTNISLIWKQAESQIKPLYDSGLVMGFFMGDELTWNGLPYNDLVLSIEMVRASFPKPAIILYNEAYPVFTQDINSHNQKIGYNTVPTALDWLSMDFYPDEGTFQDNINIYNTKIFPKMNIGQSALYVPPGYATSQNEARYCGIPNCTEAMLNWAVESYRWALLEQRIVGLYPWHYNSYTYAQLPGFEIGVESMPAVLAKWKEIGKAIITAKSQ